jgi:hypothetical protein
MFIIPCVSLISPSSFMFESLFNGSIALDGSLTPPSCYCCYIMLSLLFVRVALYLSLIDYNLCY